MLQTLVTVIVLCCI